MKKLTTEEFIEKSNRVHKFKYDYSLTIYCGKRKKILIKCPIHGVFEQNAGSHMSGVGCKKCGIMSRSKKRTISNDEFIEKAKKIHYHKYDYTNTNYIKNNNKVKIKCPIHGVFEQLPLNHLKGHGCKRCALEISSESIRSNTVEFIGKAKKVHGNKYDYSLVNYVDSASKIKLKCYKHGIFETTPNSHLSNGSGCKKCSKKEKITPKLLTERARLIHGDKYTYEQVINIKNNRQKIPITCIEHGAFYQSTDAHLNQKQGCPRCYVSKGELKIHNILIENNINFISQKEFDSCINPRTNKKLKFDFYLPEHNLCIEYDGKQHFMPIKKYGGEEGHRDTVYRDSVKNSFCKKIGIKLVRIKFNESIYKKVMNIIK